MISILDSAPYPWQNPLAVELHRTLYRTVPRPSRALLVASTAGIDTGLVNSDQAPFDVWKELLELSAASQKTRVLIQHLRNDRALTVAHPLFDSLLSNREPITDREPYGPNGAPVFIRKDDSITEAEALLFHDDLTLSMGRVPWLIEVLQLLVSLAPGVCRIEVAKNNQSQSGTAFHIGRNLLLSNWHVLFLAGSPATSVTAEFGFESDVNGNGLMPRSISCDPGSIRGNEIDDWAIVSAQSAMPQDIPVLDIFSAGDPMKDSPAFIIQHPGGGRKRLAYVRNEITYFDDRVIHYLSDTQVGSSGSPVLNDLGKVIALHHAGGRPLEVAGQLPIKKNEGIRMSRIATALSSTDVI
jgi:hypothetical protein